MKISKLQIAQLLPFLAIFFISILLLVLSPAFPEYELWRGGALGLSLLFFLGVLVLYLNWVERIKEQESSSEDEK